MSICPDNSTACLLRALLEDNTTRLILTEVKNEDAAFNWDPLNFALTAAIGVLALIVACMTVFQQLLVAGPGRIKGSRAAIGPWGTKSASNFDWIELGLRTTAFTPHIDVDIDVREITWIEQSPRSKRGPLQANPFGFSASWANLLARLGLDDHGIWENQPCKTDYLPSDIQAAPATASLKSLAILTVLSDEMSFIEASPSSRMVHVKGLYSQLSARIHPVLGPVAAYESFGRTRTSLSNDGRHACGLRRKDLRDAIMLAHGYFVIGRRKLRPADLSLNEQYHWLAENVGRSLLPAVDQYGFVKADSLPLPILLMIGEVSLHPRAFPKEVHQLRHGINHLCYESMWTWTSFAKLESVVAPESAQILWDLAGPRHHPTSRVNRALNEFRKRPSFTWFTPRDDEAELQQLASEIADKSNTLWLSQDTGVFCYTLAHVMDESNQDTENILREQARFKQLRSETFRHNARDMLLAEIFMTDLFLRAESRLKVLCAMFVLLRTMSKSGRRTITHRPTRPATPVSAYQSVNSYDTSHESLRSALSVIDLTGPDAYKYENAFTFDIPESAFRDGSYFRRVGDVYAATDAGPGCYPSDSDRLQIGKLAAMLRFRALLFAALLDLCADTSCFFDGTVNDAVVKVL